MMQKKKNISLILLFCALLLVLLSRLVFGSGIVSAQTLTPTPPSNDEPVILDFPEIEPSISANQTPPIYELPHALTRYDHFYFARPLFLEESGYHAPDFRYGYLYTDLVEIHTGIDFAAPQRHPVLAAGDGKVVFSGLGLTYGSNSSDDPYGIAVMIRHTFGFDGFDLYSIYAHLDSTLVKSGQWVKNGDKIGLIGLTGATSGPHLHFEVRVEKNGKTSIQNPELWLAPAVGSGVLAGKVANTNGSLLPSKELWLRSLASGQTYTLVTYAAGMLERDTHYQENLVYNDLPEGSYEISTYYNYVLYKKTIRIVPGAVNYINFAGSQGFQ